jgi:hypothetical protein
MNRFTMGVVAGVFALTSAYAQTTGGGSSQTCTAPATGVNKLTLERSLSITTVGTTQNLAANIDKGIFNQIALGNLEVREQFNYDPSGKVLTSTVFAAAPSSSMPTELSTIPNGQSLGGYSIAVDNVYFSCSPVPNVLMVGKIASTGAGTPYGSSLNGAPAAVSFGYTTDNPPKVNNVVVVVAGVVAAYSAAGAGTLDLIAPPVVTPPGSGGGPGIVVEGGPDQITSARQITLKATATDPGGTQMSYAWTQPTPGTASVPACVDPNLSCTLKASIQDANTSTPTVTFSSGKGDYLFVLTATNAAGASATQIVRIRYIGTI